MNMNMTTKMKMKMRTNELYEDGGYQYCVLKDAVLE